MPSTGSSLTPRRPAPSPEDVGFAVADGVASRLISVENAQGDEVGVDGEYLLISPSLLDECNAAAAAPAPAAPLPTNDTSSEQDGNAVVSSAPLPPSGGYLQKYGEKGFLKTWKLRWFELHPHRKLLFYYKNRPERGGSRATPLGQILISNAAMSLSKAAHELGHFTISSENRDYKLIADDKEQMHTWIKQIQIARSHIPNSTTISVPPMLVIGHVSLPTKSSSMSLIPSFTPRAKLPAATSAPAAAASPPPPTFPQAASSDDEAGSSSGGGVGSWFRRRKAEPPRPSIGLSEEEQGENVHCQDCGTLLAENSLVRQQLKDALDLARAQPADGGGNGGGAAAVVLGLQQQISRLELDLRHTKDALRVSQDRETMLEELSKGLRRVTQNAVPDSQGADEAEMAYYVRCVDTQNQLLNAEILNMCVQRKKMEAWHAEQLNEIPKCRMERDQTSTEHLELLRLIVQEPSIEVLRRKAQAIMERGMARSQSSGIGIVPSGAEAEAPDQQLEAGAIGGPAYNVWGFLIDNQDLSGALGALKLQNAGNQGDLLRQWELYLEQTRGGIHQVSRGIVSEFKSMVRSGVPNKFRKEVWSRMIETRVGAERKACNAAKEVSYYRRQVASSCGPSVSTKQIELDLLRTCPSHRDFKDIASPKIASLRNILVAYSQHNPDIGYCQGMNMIAATGLLFLDEEDVFWMMVAVIEQILPDGYYSTEMIGSQVDQRVVRDLMSERAPKLSAHLEKHEVDIGLVTFSWMLTIFIDALPTGSMLRVWDVFLHEGSKIPFRAALGMFLMHQAQIIKADNRQDIYDLLRSIPSTLYDVDTLFEYAFHRLDGSRGFSMRRIAEKRARRRKEVQAEMIMLQRRRDEFNMTKCRTSLRRVEDDEDDDEETVSGGGGGDGDDP